MSDFYGTWAIVQATPIGKMSYEMTISDDSGAVRIEHNNAAADADILGTTLDGDTLIIQQALRKPIAGKGTTTLKLVSPTEITGRAKIGIFPSTNLTGTKKS